MTDPLDRTAHTLHGVLTRLRAGGARDAELERRLNDAFSKHEKALRRYCSHELRGAPVERVDEVVQEVLLEAWNKLPGYQPVERFRAFLFGIASFKCANARRKHFDVLTQDGFLDETSTERTILERLADEERDALVEQAAASVLDAKDQELVHLRWVMDYPREEVAKRSGLRDAEEVRVGLVRCKRRLEKEIRRLLQERGLGESFLRGG